MPSHPEMLTQRPSHLPVPAVPTRAPCMSWRFRLRGIHLFHFFDPSHRAPPAQKPQFQLPAIPLEGEILQIAALARTEPGVEMAETELAGVRGRVPGEVG